MTLDEFDAGIVAGPDAIIVTASMTRLVCGRAVDGIDDENRERGTR
jgi:hypothetical protein